MGNSTCDCCEGVESITPEPISNRPGLDTIAYRVGTHGSFLESMEARLSQMEVEVEQAGGSILAERPMAERAMQSPSDSGAGANPATTERPLTAFTTRDPGDPAIALLDGWATVADVLTFYQERIANEGFLRTATERRSILELGRLVDYRLRPGVAATVYLAYTLDARLTEKAEIPLYTASQSIPGPGELPQTFETVEKIEARAKWNILQPRLTRPQTMASIREQGKIYFQGVTTNLRKGDPLLIDDGTGKSDANPSLWRVMDVAVDAPLNRTTVEIAEWNPVSKTAMDRVNRSAALEEYKKIINAATLELLQTIDPSTSNAAANAVGVLKGLTAKLANAQDLTIDNDVQNTLRQLVDMRDHLPSSATVVRPWLERTIQTIGNAQQRALEAAKSAASNETAGVILGTRKGEFETVNLEGDQMRNVMRGLSRPPSLPPRNALYQRRDIQSAFQHGSDVGLQVVGTVKPELQTLLPEALANLKAAPSQPLAVYALRVQAGVYGSTAPKRQISDDNGRVVGTVEWPIDGSLQLTLRWEQFFDSSGAKGGYDVSVDLASSDTGFKNYNLHAEAGKSDKRDDGPYSIELDVADDQAKEFTVSITLKNANVTQVIKFTPGSNSSFFTVSATTNNLTDFTARATSNETIFMTRNRPVRLSYGLREQGGFYATEFPLAPTPPNAITLDGPYDMLVPGDYAVVLHQGKTSLLVTQIDTASTSAHNDYNVPAKVTELTLTDNWLINNEMYLSDIRDTSVLTGSETLALDEEPIDDPVCTDDPWIELDGLYSDLKAGRWLIIEGTRSDIVQGAGITEIQSRNGRTPAPDGSQAANDPTVPGLLFAELVMLADVVHSTVPPGSKQVALPGDANHTFIRLSADTSASGGVSFCYARDQVKIYGNVVKATHGETRNETLGAGDGTLAFQAFVLKQAPLTFVSAPTAAGAESTLHVYVNNVLWHETESFVDLGPTDRGFVTLTGDDDKVTVITGDGKTGARLPTGQENVRAIYRQGLGKAGNVRAGQISLLKSRPLGVKEVINPVRASGGADREGVDQARKNVPLGTMALDRLVSLQDYTDLTRTFAGIGKALAVQLPFGSREVVHVTIAGADDIPIDPTSDLYRNLLLALQMLGDPDVPVRVDLRELLLITLQANISILPDYLWDTVVNAIRTRLYAVLSFENSELGEDVYLSRVVSAMQSVEGVAYVDVQMFGAIPEKTADPDGTRRLLTPDEISEAVLKMVKDQAQKPPQRVVVDLAEVEGKSIRPAQLAFLSPDVPATLILNQVTE